MAGIHAAIAGVGSSFAPLTAADDTGDLYKLGAGGNLTTAAVTVSPVGGTPDFDYGWAKVSGDDIGCNFSTQATTTFSTSGLAEGESRTALYKCFVSDGLGVTVVTRDITVTLERL